MFLFVGFGWCIILVGICFEKVGKVIVLVWLVFLLYGCCLCEIDVLKWCLVFWRGIWIIVKLWLGIFGGFKVGDDLGFGVCGVEVDWGSLWLGLIEDCEFGWSEDEGRWVMK